MALKFIVWNGGDPTACWRIWNFPYHFMQAVPPRRVPEPDDPDVKYMGDDHDRAFLAACDANEPRWGRHPLIDEYYPPGHPVRLAVAQAERDAVDIQSRFTPEAEAAKSEAQLSLF